MRAKFVDSTLRSLKPKGIKYDVHDPEGTGLLLHVSPHGKKTWMMTCRSPSNAVQHQAIGTYPALSIAEAREIALRLGESDKGGADES
ncbi:MAG TPA: Arm DNA-binding domain-containing protein [Kiloniellales bacterium]